MPRVCKRVLVSANAWQIFLFANKPVLFANDCTRLQTILPYLSFANVPLWFANTQPVFANKVRNALFVNEQHASANKVSRLQTPHSPASHVCEHFPFANERRSFADSSRGSSICLQIERICKHAPPNCNCMCTCMHSSQMCGGQPLCAMDCRHLRYGQCLDVRYGQCVTPTAAAHRATSADPSHDGLSKSASHHVAVAWQIHHPQGIAPTKRLIWPQSC